MVHSLNFVQPSLQMKNSLTSPEQKWSLKRLGKCIYLVLSPMICACYLNNYLETCVTSNNLDTSYAFNELGFVMFSALMFPQLGREGVGTFDSQYKTSHV